MKSLNNAGVSEIVYFQEYKRIQTGGEKFEEEDEAKELAEKRGIIVRQFRPKKLVAFVVPQKDGCEC
jgi:deoxycytidylate deaminase